LKNKAVHPIIQFMKQLLIALGMVAVVGLSGCVAAVVGGAAAGAYYVGKDERSADRIAADAAITADVKTRLIAEPGIRSFSINVDTFNGMVILKGDVKSAAQRATAESLAKKASGVKSVRNELAIKG
jgi:hyperosmotically inducible periplasmic protein